MNIPWKIKMNVDSVLCGKGTRAYSETCQLYNKAVKKSPLAIFLPQSTDDIRDIIQYCTANDLAITVKNGGHGAAGQSLVDDGIVCDMRLMKAVDHRPYRNELSVEGGVLNIDVDSVTTRSEQAIPLGTCPYVGVAGSSLGGGIGFLSRKYGLACDSIEQLEIVTGSMDVLTVNRNNYVDLFESLKGSGQNNYGVVTKIYYRTNQSPPSTLMGTMAWTLSNSSDVLNKYFDFMRSSSNDVFFYCSLNYDIGDIPTVQLFGGHLGDSFKSAEIFDDFRHLAPPYHTDLMEMNYRELQTDYEENLPERPNLMWNSGFLKGCPPESFSDAVLRAFEAAPPGCRMHFDPLGGAIGKGRANHSSFFHRPNDFTVSIAAIWNNQTDYHTHKAWLDRTHASLRPFMAGGKYVNYDSETSNRDPFHYFGSYLPKLRNIKERYDPKKLFIGTLS